MGSGRCPKVSDQRSTISSEWSVISTSKVHFTLSHQLLVRHRQTYNFVEGVGKGVLIRQVTQGVPEMVRWWQRSNSNDEKQQLQNLWSLSYVRLDDWNVVCTGWDHVSPREEPVKIPHSVGLFHSSDLTEDGRQHDEQEKLTNRTVETERRAGAHPEGAAVQDPPSPPLLPPLPSPLLPPSLLLLTPSSHPSPCAAAWRKVQWIRQVHVGRVEAWLDVHVSWRREVVERRRETARNGDDRKQDGHSELPVRWCHSCIVTGATAAPSRQMAGSSSVAQVLSQFLAPVEFFFAVERLEFLTWAEFLFFDYTDFPAWFVTSTLCYLEGNVLPLWKVKGLEQYTSWKVRVPECFLLEKYEHQHVHTHIHIFHVRVHVNVRVHVCLCVFLMCGVVSCRVPRVVGWLGGWVVGWLVGWVVGCGVVWSGRSIATGKSGAFND